MNNSWFKKMFQKTLNEETLDKKEIPAEEEKGGVVITFGRELGSAGSKVAKKVAEKLNYNYYDKEIITKAAKDSGIDEKLFSQINEADLDSFWFDFSKEAYDNQQKNVSFKEVTASDKLFMIQSDAIREVAKSGNAVIVGRCATYILKNQSKKIFICAEEKDRIERIKRMYKVSTKVAKDIMQKSDEKRSIYHSYYTNQNWKDKNNYDLYINTTEVGIEKAANMIVDLIKKQQ